MTPLALKLAGHSGLHVRHEKAGLILDSLPIPANADAVIVEANVRVSAKAARRKEEFSLAWADDAARHPAEVLASDAARSMARVLFRVATPAQTRVASIVWRENLLGQIEVPIIGMPAWIDGVAVEMPEVLVSFGDRVVPCRAFVSGQGKSVFATAVLRGPGQLAALADADFRVQLTHFGGRPLGAAPVVLTSEQMRRRQTLVTAQLAKPRGLGQYELSWRLAERTLVTQGLRVVSKRAFAQSLRVSASRFRVHMNDGSVHTVRAMPGRDGKLVLDGMRAVQPVFFLVSSEPGIAGLAPFTLRALIDDVITTLAMEKDVLVTDGLRAIALAGVPVADLPRVKYFSLASGDAILGNLSLDPAPVATFTAEGGFAALEDFLWSPAADELLNDRLEKLLGDS